MTSAKWRTQLARFSVALALLSLYLVWGSTYLSVEFILPVVPPLLIAGLRFTLCGVLLYSALRLSGRSVKPRTTHWLLATASGLCLILGGNAMVVVAQQWITSSLAALLVATVPFFMAVFGWMSGARARPRIRELLLLFAGLIGVALVIQPGQLAGGESSLEGALLVLGAAASWAVGSLIARSPNAHPSPMVFASMQMLAAGPVLLLLSTLLGEPGRVQWEALDTAAVIAFAHLTIVGTVAGYCVYVWLVRNADGLAATSYAYVNPVVAVILGATILREPISGRMLLGGGVVLLSVAFLLRSSNRPAPIEPPTRDKQIDRHRREAAHASNP
ncbi:MAG: EamA family transporter [Verrucomicrobia bacterium]|jgi:drug/metabolite transporter (DMT)-like permease|nr:EamA family transporter [Verrucomicrobiota bacterium]